MSEPPSSDVPGTNELVAWAAYRVDRPHVALPNVSVALFSQGIEGERAGYSFRVWMADPHGGSMDKDDFPSVIPCKQLFVECRKEGPPSGLDPDEALRLTGKIARDIRTAMFLHQAQLGFPMGRFDETVTG